MLSFQHATAVAQVNSEWLWLPVRDTDKNKPVSILAWPEAGLPYRGATGGCPCKREPFFVTAVAADRLLVPMHYTKRT